MCDAHFDVSEKDVSVSVSVWIIRIVQLLAFYRMFLGVCAAA
jgi:hypothetical protein